MWYPEGKYKFQSTIAEDFWVVGVNEASSLLDPRSGAVPPFLGVHRVPLPFDSGDTQLRFQAFDGSTLVAVLNDEDDAGQCSLYKFHLTEAQGDDLSRVSFVAADDGAQRVTLRLDQPFKDMREICDVYASRPAQQEFWAEPLPYGENGSHGVAIVDRGKVELGRLTRTKVLASYGTLGPGTLDSEMMLVPGEDCVEFDFFGDMCLYDWRTNELVKTVPLHYPTSCHSTGVLDGDSQTFFVLRCDWTHESLALYLCSPVVEAD